MIVFTRTGTRGAVRGVVNAAGHKTLEECKKYPASLARLRRYAARDASWGSIAVVFNETYWILAFDSQPQLVAHGLIGLVRKYILRFQ